MQDPLTLRRLVDLLQGNDIRYQMAEDADTHPLVGRWAPELTLITANGRQHVADLMHNVRGVLFDFDNCAFCEHPSRWSHRVDVIRATCASGPPARALLIRPDGYVAWAGNTSDSLEPSLRRWFGAPSDSR